MVANIVKSQYNLRYISINEFKVDLLFVCVVLLRSEVCMPPVVCRRVRVLSGTLFVFVCV
jgi:hypothetical protein